MATLSNIDKHGITDDFLLMESGDFLLLESGSKILIRTMTRLANLATHLASLVGITRNTATLSNTTKHSGTLTNERLKRSLSHQDLSTIIICPTRGMIPARAVQAWQGLIRPMNQKVFGPIFAIGMEVGVAYSQMIENILRDPNLSTFKYILSIEEDNIPPPDGLMKLYESLEGMVDGNKYDCVGGLYWTKGEGGQPMIYGDPKVAPLNFIPQIPVVDGVQPANGLGMGFNLWRLEMFKDGRLRKPWFKTCNELTPTGTKIYTQDLYFYEDALQYGYKFACDTRVKVGHLDVHNDFVW